MRMTKETRDEFRRWVVQIPDDYSIVRENALALLDTADALESDLATARAEIAAKNSGCGHQLTESESNYYDNRPHLIRLCKRCAMEERAR